MCLLQLFQSFESWMILLFSHLLGQLGEHLQDGKTQGQALDSGGDVGLDRASLGKELGGVRKSTKKSRKYTLTSFSPAVMTLLLLSLMSLSMSTTSLFSWPASLLTRSRWRTESMKPKDNIISLVPRWN